MITIPRLRALALTALPLAVSALLSVLLITGYLSERLGDHSRAYAASVTSHLALAVTDHLVNEDKLSLNVMLSDLVEREHFLNASVYDAAHNLVAQAGNVSRQQQVLVFTEQVTFQNTLAGHVRVSFDAGADDEAVRHALIISLVIHGGLLLLVAGLTWFAGDLLFLWVTAQRARTASAPVAGPDPIAIEQASGPIQDADPADAKPASAETVLLVIKVRPGRLANEYHKRVTSALTLHGGDTLHRGSDDYVVAFAGTDAHLRAVCAALLLHALAERVGPPLHFKTGLHSDADPDHSPDMARKHASYLASIAEDQLLASRVFFEAIAGAGQYVSEPYRSSLTPDGEVYVIRQLTNQNLIVQQARQLFSR